MKPRYNLSNYHSLFTDFLISEDISPITLKNYRSDLKHFFGWYGTTGIAGDLFENLTAELIEKYRDELSTEETPNKTTNRRMSTLRKFCTFAISQGWMKHNPAKKVLNLTHTSHTRPSSVILEDPAMAEDDRISELKSRDPIPAMAGLQGDKSTILAEFEEEYPVHAKNLEDYFQIINSYPQTNG